MFKISDEEYAVLDYIRSRKGTHIDHLNIVFKSSAEPAVKNLEKYALIAPDFPNKDIYHATMLGNNYQHEVNSESEFGQICKETNSIENQANNHKNTKSGRIIQVVIKSAAFIASLCAIITFFKQCA